MHFDRSEHLFLYGALLLGAAVLSGSWIRDDLRQGVACWDLWERPRRSETPDLFWIAIARQACRTLLLAVFGLALVEWGLMT
jgi:hypothetical protein